MYYLLIVHGNNDCTKAPQCYVIRNVLVFFLRGGGGGWSCSLVLGKYQDLTWKYNSKTSFHYHPLHYLSVSASFDGANPQLVKKSTRKQEKYQMLSVFIQWHIHYLRLHLNVPCGPGSSVGIATDYGLDRIPVGTRFFAHVQTDPGAHPASCTMGTGSFPGVKRPGRSADHQLPSSPEVKKR
jgi:hypothetical protein